MIRRALVLSHAAGGEPALIKADVLATGLNGAFSRVNDVLYSGRTEERQQFSVDRRRRTTAPQESKSNHQLISWIYQTATGSSRSRSSSVIRPQNGTDRIRQSLVCDDCIRLNDRRVMRPSAGREKNHVDDVHDLL